MPPREKNSHPERLKILMLGIGDFSPRRFYSTCFLVLVKERKILVDCPDPLRRILYEGSRRSGLKLDLQDIDDIIITHLHGDHANGLESLGFYKRFAGERRPTIYTISAVAADLWEHKLSASMHRINDLESMKPKFFSLSDYFKIRLLKEDKINHIKGLKVQIRQTRHYLPCFGLKIGYGGRWVGYSSDTTFDTEHITFLSNCDLILHETNSGGHTPYEKLLTLPEAIRKKMLLVHLPDDFNTRRSKIPCAEEGKIYCI